MKTITKLTLLLLAAILPAIAPAHDFEVDGIYYNINGNEVEVTYKGWDYYNAQSYSGEVTIPYTVIYNSITYAVTSIGNYAFYNCNKVTIISIPNSVITIGISVFSYCSELTSIMVENDNPTYDSRDNCNAIIETVTNTLLLVAKTL